MGATGRFTFNQTPCGDGQQTVGASQVFPNSSSGPYFYEIWDGPSITDGRMIGAIAYDYAMARWSCVFFVAPGLRTHQPTTFTDDIGEIKAFIATLPSAGPVPLTDEVGNDVNWPPSLTLPTL